MTDRKIRRRRRKEARPSEIVEAAFAEFAERGFGNSTLAGIARRAGISRTTIYLYYETKEAIFEAAIRGSVETTIDRVARMIETADGDFRTVFSRVIDTIYGRLVEGEASVILKVLIAEGHQMPALVAFYRTEILSKGERTIEALMARGIASGELSPACRTVDVRVVIAPAIFAAIWTRVFNMVDPLDLDAFKEAHLQFVCDALLART